MRLLMVNYEYPPLGGGGGCAMHGVARELARRHTVHVLTSAAPGLAAKEEAPDRDLTVFRAPVPFRKARVVASLPSMLGFYPAGLRLGTRLLRRQTYDAINTWFAIPSGPTGIGLARRFGVFHLLTLIGGDVYDPSRWYSPHRNPLLGRVVRGVLRGSDGRTAISSDVAERAGRYYGFDEPIEVVALGTEQPRCPPVSRRALGLPADAFVVVTVGRLVRRKDLPTLLRAFARLGEDGAHLVVVGRGPERRRLERLARRLGLGGRVDFRGFVPEERKLELLAAADVFALPSLHEGFGLVFVEAMSCGLPVVTTRGGGQEDFLEHGETGLLVPVRDPAALAAALLELRRSPERRRAIGAANRERSRRYSIAETARRYERLLRPARLTPAACTPRRASW